ncbi:radial spoke head 10 homolog B-like [Mangifera indica]|uniref:radial spoke head 10 homolog B-like n=1 Tax=Mangifera indica TaxID=29780 RepID=UPI001CFC09F6|nr:radial spoke head 10 homolog B-like [Mangifera indica]
MMTQLLSSSPIFSSFNNLQNNESLNLESSSYSFLCFSFTTNSSAYKLVQTLCRFGLRRFHLKFLILFSVPSLCFFVTNPHRFIVLSFLSIIAFFITLFVISLKLALPGFPSLRLVLTRLLPIKFTTLNTSSWKEPVRPVVWSIGSKPKPAKNPISGSWVKAYSNGDVYEGEFHIGKCSGSGVYYYYKKGRYEGDWIDGKYDGYGVETWARGSRYRGQYRQGLRHGIGAYRFYTGDVYAGEWSNGQCHGCGVHTCVDGSIYIGEFKWGVKHGLGHYHFRNGDTYSGEYFADRMHGFGIYEFGNGHRYEGAWHEGRRQGLGMYTFRSGETQYGHWQNGVLDVPSTQNPHPASLYPVNHFKVLNASQEAQQAAAKAYDVAKVDERVNKVVAAANKAAHAARVASVKAVQNQTHYGSDDIEIPFDP